MVKIVGVRFRSAGKVYYFNPEDLQVRIGEHVIAETSKGPEYGTISTCTKMVDEELVLQPLRSLVRKATQEDEEKIVSLRVKEKEALKVCREKVREHELDMKMVDAEYSFDGTKVLFYFTADGRVDFRNLVKDLASVFHVRIELRQIGVRDETRMLGGIGICGRELCCATYLREFQPVSIKMAKEQNLSLNPAKISGTCGRLMCCLKNEEATYEFLNAKMPKMGEEAITADGQVGKVVELDVLRQRVRVLFEEGDTKEMEIFPVSELTFRPRKKKDPSQQGKKNKAEKGDQDRKTEGRGGKSEQEKNANGKSDQEKSANGRSDQGKNANGRPEQGKFAEGKPEQSKDIDEASERDDYAGEYIENEQDTAFGEDDFERKDRRDRGSRTEKSSKRDRSGNDRSDRRDRSERRDKADRGERTEKTDRADRADRREREDGAERNERKRPRRKKNPKQDGANSGGQSRNGGRGAAGGKDGVQANDSGVEEGKGYVRKNKRHRSRHQDDRRQDADSRQGADNRGASDYSGE